MTEVVRLSDFTTRPIRWLWYGRLARGKVTLVDGDPGDNKSTLSLDIAARLTTGRPLPTFDGSDIQVASPEFVALMTAEDDPADTVLPRFLAAGGDPERAAWVPQARPMVDDDGLPVSVSTALPDDLDLVRDIMERTGASLLIVDPLTAYLGGTVDTHRDNAVRAALRPVADLAAEVGFAVLAIRHFTKSGGGRAMHRGGGSVAFVGAARVGLTVVRDPDADDRRLLSVSKCNIAREQPTLAYRIATDPNLDQPVLVWEGIDERSADDLVNVEDDHSEAERFILSILADGPVPAARVHGDANAAGIPRSTLMAAKKRLGVASDKSGFDGGWSWSLPAERDVQPCATCGQPSTCSDRDGSERCDLHVSWAEGASG